MTAPSLSAPWAPPHVLVVKSPEQKEELRWLLPNGEGVEWHSGCCVHRQCPDCLALGIKNYHCTKHRHHATTHRTLCDHPNCPCHSANHSTSDFFNSGSHLGVVVTMAADPLSISPSAPSTGGGSMGPHPAPWRHPFESTVTTAIPTTTTTTTTTSSSSDDRGLKPWRQGILVDARRGNPVASGSDSSNSKSRRVVATGRGGRPTASSAAPPSPPSTGGNVLVSPFLPSTAATTVSSPVVATTMIANTRSPLATRPPQSIVGTPHTEYCRPTSCPPSSSTQRRYHFAGDYASTNAAPGSGVHADGRSFTPPPRWTTTRTFAGVGGLVGSNGIRGPPHGGYVGQQPLGSVVVSATTSESLASGSPTNLTAQLHKQDHQRQLTAPTTMSSSNLHRPLQQFNLSYNQVLPVITGNSDPRYQYDKAPSTGHFQQVDPTMVRTTPMVVRESDDARPAFEMVPLPAVRRQYSEISMNGEISTTSRFGVVDSANVQQHDSQRHHSTSSSSIRRSVIRPSASPGVHSTPLFQAQDNISERVAAAGYSSSSQVPSISVRQMPSFGCYDDIGRAGSGPQVNPLAPSDFRNRSATVIRRNVAAADTASGRRQQVSTPVTTTRRTATATRGADGELYYHHNDCCDDGRSDFVGASHPVAVPTNASAIQGWESMNGSPSIMNEEGNRKTIKVSVGEGGSDGQLLGSLGCRSYDWVIESAAERCGLSEAEVLDLRNLLSDHYLRNTLALRKAVMYDRLPRGVSADVKEAFEFYLRQLAQSVHVRVLMHGSGGQTATGRSASQATKQSVSQYSRHEGQFSVSWTGTAGKGDGGEAAAARLDSDELSSSLTTTTGQQGEFHQATQTDYPASALSGVASSSVDSCGGESSAYLECEAPARTTKECDAQTSFRAEVVVVEREVLPSRMEVGATEGTAQTAAVDSYEVGAQTSDRSIAEGWTQTSHRAAIEGGMQATAITDEGGAQTVTVESGYDVAAQTSDRSVAEGWTQTSQRATTDGGTQTTNMLTEGAVQTAQAEMGSDAVAQTSARSVAEGYTQTSARAFVDRVAQTTAGSPKGMREYGAQTSARRVAEGATSVRGLVEFREKNTSPLHTFHHRDMKTSPGRGNYLIDAGTSPGRVGEYLMNRGVSPGRGEQFLVDAETSPRILSQPSVAAQTEIDFGAYLRSIRRRMLAVPQVGVQLRPRKPTLRKVTAAARVDIPSELDAVWDEIRRLEEELVESRTTVTASNMARAGMEDQLRASDAAKAEEIARLNAEGIAAAEAYRQLLEELEELRNLLSQSRTTKALSHVGGAWVDMQPSAAVTQQVEPRKLGLGTTIETASQVPAPHSLDKSPLLRCADSPPGDPPALTASHVLSTFVPPSIVRTPFDDLLDRKALEASPSIPPRRASTPRQFAPPSLSLVNTPEVEVRAGPPPSKSDRGGSESSSVSPAAAQLPKQRSVSGDAPRKASSRTYEGDLLHPRADAFQMALVVRGFDSTAQGNSLAKRHSDMSGGSGKVSQMLGTRTTPVAPPAKSQTELLRPRPTAFEMGLAARHMQGAYRGKQGGLNASVAASTASGFGWSTTAGASMLGDPSRTSSTRMRRQSRSFVQPPTKTGSGAAGESKLQKAATGEQSPPALSQMVSGANLHRLPSTDSESDADGLGGRGFQWRVEDSADRRHHLGHRGAVGADGTVDTSTPTESTAGFGEESVGSSPEKVSGMIGGSSALPPGDRRYTFGTGAQRRRQEDVDDSRDSNVPPVGRRDILESTGMYVAESGGGEKSSINENSSSLPNLVRGGSTVAVVTDSSNTADSVVGEVTAVEKKADGQDARWATTSSSQHQDGTTTVGTAVGGFDDRSSGGQDVTTVGTAEADERWGGDRDVETMRSTSGELRERTSGELHERSSAVLGSAVEFDDGARYLNEGSGLAENLDDDDDDDDEGKDNSKIHHHHPDDL